MRLILILTIAGCFNANARGFSQLVTIHKSNASLEIVFKEIKRQTGFHFLYNLEWLRSAKQVSLNVTNAPLVQVLDHCFQGQPFTYEIVDNTISLKPKPALLANGTDITSLPPVKVTGNVTDENGQALLGATIKLRNGAVLAITDEKGNFTIDHIDPNSIIDISYTGFTQSEVKIDNRLSISVSLIRSTNKLDEAQIIAYGSGTQRYATGDVSTLTSKQIENQPVTNILATLEGQIPGLFISQNTGLPGASFNVQLRGRNSIAQGNDPLYVIDGVPYSSELLATLNPAGGSPFSFLDISNIESISVLKDAAATAIYGSRGANGVILITTKKGKIGKSVIEINSYTGVGKVPHFMNLLSTPQYLAMRHQAFANDNVTPTLNNAPDLFMWDTTRYTDWQKQLLGGNAITNDIQGNVSGGNENVQYLLGGGYHRETTVFPSNTSDQKASAHISLTHVSDNKKFKITFSGNFVSEISNVPSYDPTGIIPGLPPDAPKPFNNDGSLNWENTTWTNPYAYFQTKFKSTTTNFISNSVLSYKIIKGLDIKTSLGYNLMQTNEISSTPTTYYAPAYHVASGRSQFIDNNIHSWIIEPQLAYQAKIWNGSFQALVGTSIQNVNSSNRNLYATGFSNDALLQNIASASTIIPLGSSNPIYKYNAGFGRINYNLLDKYLLDFTIRRDGSSRFGPENRFHNFSALGLGWLFSNEAFLRDKTFLSYGKVRGSFGITGNDQIGDYTYLDLYGNTQYPYGGVSGLYPQNIYNPNLQWEVNKKIEVGIDLGALNDRILVSLNYFRNRSSNELVSYNLPTITGFSSILSNLPAVVQNDGFEVSVNTVNIKTRTFSWTTSLNLTIPRNKLIAYPNIENSSYKYQYQIGKPIIGFKAYHYMGVNDTTGFYQFSTAKGVPTSNPNVATDLTDFVNRGQKYYGGITNVLKYKAFEFDFTFQFVKQLSPNFSYSINRNTQPGFFLFNAPTTVLDSWKESGDTKSIQRFTQDNYNENTYIYYLNNSNGGYTNGSFIRFRNAAISYQLPKTLLKKNCFQNIRLYIKGQNLFTLTHHYIGYDPETQSNLTVPLLRTITGGLQLSF